MLIRLKKDIYLYDGIEEVTLLAGNMYELIEVGLGGGWPTLIDNNGEEFDVAIEDEEFNEYFEKI